MTNNEWKKLCREVKNKGDYFIFQQVVSHFMGYFKRRQLEIFILNNHYQTVLNWYRSYYNREIK